ncbi:MAG: DinB family protein [Spirosomataceae bacterium]
MKILQETNIDIIRQLINLLDTLPAGMYHLPLKSLHENSIGQHTRHIVEFYQCLLNGMSGQVVNYDARERNLRIETDKAYTSHLLAAIASQLEQATEDKPMVLEQAFGLEEPLTIPTYFSRELTYLIEHTIHHLAIIKIGLTESFPTVYIPAEFGVAHSTLKFRQQQASA